MACAKVSGSLYHTPLLLLSRASPLIISKRFQKREIKRFYKAVSITQNERQFEINLDRKRLKTPMGNIFRVPNEPLALAIAAEWGSQKEAIRQGSMHLTNLCNSAIDNPLKQTKDDITEHILKFMDTDTICFRMEEPPELHELQNRAWGAVIDWIRKRHNVEIGASSSILGPGIPESTKETIGRYLRSHDMWALVDLVQDGTAQARAECTVEADVMFQLRRSLFFPRMLFARFRLKNILRKFRDSLVWGRSDFYGLVWTVVCAADSGGTPLFFGFQHAVESLKSVLLTFAMVDRHLSVETAVALSRLEEEFQIAHWGNVEWAHDLELMHLKANVAASLLFIYLNTEVASVSQKTPVASGERS